MRGTNIMSAITLLAALAACNTAEGVKKDANIAAEKSAEAAATTGEAMGGAMKTGEVKAAIMADTLVNATDVNVDTDEAKMTVTLNGTVKTAAQRTRAGEVAAAKATGYSIVNNLTIKP